MSDTDPTNKRRFALLYDGAIAPDDFLAFLARHEGEVSSVLVRLPAEFDSEPMSWFDGQDPRAGDRMNAKQARTGEFLMKAKGRPFKRVLCLNATFYRTPAESFDFFVRMRLLGLMKNFGIDAVVVADIILARMIRNASADIDIQSSFNDNLWTVRVMNKWREDLAVKLFNPPREVLRTPSKLEELKEAGIQVRAIVNDNCIYGCPMRFHHDMMDMYPGRGTTRLYCMGSKLRDLFKQNWVLPRHLDTLDPYVAEYQINNVGMNLEQLELVLTAYRDGRDDVNFEDLIFPLMAENLKRIGLTIPVKAIPDKILTCEMKDCATCDVCVKAMRALARNAAKPIDEALI